MDVDMKNIKWPAIALVIGKSAVDWYYGWVDFVLMTLFWVVAQVTVFFGPPVTFGFYYAINVLIETGENVGIKGVLLGTKKYFWKGLGWGVVNWVVFILAAINFYFYENLDNDFGFFIEFFVIILFVVWIITQYFALPVFFVQENKSIFLAMRNGFFLAMGSPFFSLGILVLTAVLLALCIWLVIPIFIGVPGLIMMLGTRAAYHRLETLGLVKEEIDPREVE
jgi:hypothetical protein